MKDNGAILHVGVWLILGISTIEKLVPYNESHTISSTNQGFSRGKSTTI